MTTPDLNDLTPLTSDQEDRWIARLAAHRNAGEEGGDSEEVVEMILDIG